MTFSLFLFVYLVENVAAGPSKFRNDYMFASELETFYKLHDQPKTWTQARQACDDEGTTLLVPETLTEMDNIKVLMSNMKPQYSAIFVGIHDQYADGNFITVRGDHVSLTVQNLMWQEGSPDSLRHAEHCVVMTRVGLLDDRPCSDVYPFICKIRIHDFEYYEDCDGFDPDYVYQNEVNVSDLHKCYKFHREPLSWSDAYATCVREEAELAVVNSPEEAGVVTNILRDHVNSNVPDTNLLYLGFTDLLFPYQYRTIKGDPLDVAGFSSFHPLKEKLVANKTKRCGAISRTGYLVATDCDQPAMFLCQKTIDNNTRVYHFGDDDDESTNEYD